MAPRAPDWIHMKFDHVLIENQLENGLKELQTGFIWNLIIFQPRINSRMASRAPGRIDMKFDNCSIKDQLKHLSHLSPWLVIGFAIKYHKKTKQIKNKAGNQKVLWKLYKSQETKKTCWRTRPWACLVLNIGQRWFRSFLHTFSTLLEYIPWKNNDFIRRVGKIVELSIIVWRYNDIICFFIVCIQNVLRNLHEEQKQQRVPMLRTRQAQGIVLQHLFCFMKRLYHFSMFSFVLFCFTNFSH